MLETSVWMINLNKMAIVINAFLNFEYRIYINLKVWFIGILKGIIHRNWYLVPDISDTPIFWRLYRVKGYSYQIFLKILNTESRYHWTPALTFWQALLFLSRSLITITKCFVVYRFVSFKIIEMLKKRLRRLRLDILSTI